MVGLVAGFGAVAGLEVGLVAEIESEGVTLDVLPRNVELEQKRQNILV